MDQKSIQNRPRRVWERSGRGPGEVWRGLGGPEHEAKREKNTNERRQDPKPPRPEFLPLWCAGGGRFWGPKSTNIGPKTTPNRSKVGHKSTPQESQKKKQEKSKNEQPSNDFACFLMPARVQNRSKINPKSISKANKQKSKNV